jgi:hypothetical protein
LFIPALTALKPARILVGAGLKFISFALLLGGNISNAERRHF